MTKYNGFDREDLIKEIERVKDTLLDFSYGIVSALNDEFGIPESVDNEWIIDTLGSDVGSIYMNAKYHIKKIKESQ